MGSAAESVSNALSPLHVCLEASRHDDGLPVFTKLRARLFGIAYRILGSAAEAEDIVQDVWLRWQSTDRSVVQDPPAFLATATTRLSINLSLSVRSRRETSIATWLSEPADAAEDPGAGPERDQAMRFAVLLLLEKLSPAERAAYILREAFDYTYREIADILQTEEPNTRQLVSRARKHLVDDRHTPVTAAKQRRLLEAFIAAAHTGDMAGLENLFAEDVAPASAGICVRHRPPFLAATVWRRSMPQLRISGSTGICLCREEPAGSRLNVRNSEPRHPLDLVCIPGLTQRFAWITH